jgi:two-component system nitrate/nitrite response regulator NarL
MFLGVLGDGAMNSGKSRTQDFRPIQDPGNPGGPSQEDHPAADWQSRIIIVSDARLFREGLALSLARIDRVVVVGIADTVSSALTCIEESSPDVALLDIAMPGALTLPDAVAAASALVKIVAFSIAETEDEFCACAEAGIVGFVSRNGSKEDLVAAVQNAIRGEVVCSPRMAASLFRRLAVRVRTLKQPGPEATLTGRERDIIALIDEGFSNKEIARQLKLSTATVKNHVHNILEKLQVQRRGAAAAVLREAAALRATLRHLPMILPTGLVGDILGFLV